MFKRVRPLNDFKSTSRQLPKEKEITNLQQTNWEDKISKL